MKIIVPTTKLKEIGRLDAMIRLPTSGRVNRGMKTICRRCGKPIADDWFIAGFKKGRKNMMFHESCVPIGELMVTKEPTQ